MKKFARRRNVLSILSENKSEKKVGRDSEIEIQKFEIQYPDDATPFTSFVNRYQLSFHLRLRKEIPPIFPTLFFILSSFSLFFLAQPN